MNEQRQAHPLNPMARIAALTAQGGAASQAAPAPSATPSAEPAASAPTAEKQETQATGTIFGGTRPIVGRLAHAEASRLWPTAAAFASWVAGNLDAVGDVVSAQLRAGEMPNPDTAVVLAKNAADDAVVIVCELAEATDEGFGRLVRNVVASNAKHAIWICGEPGDQYGASVSWLNRTVDGRFSMVKVSAVTIGESAAAPLFELAVRTPRSEDEGVTASTPATDATPSSARRVDDWLNSVGVGDEETTTEDEG